MDAYLVPLLYPQRAKSIGQAQNFTAQLPIC